MIKATEENHGQQASGFAWHIRTGGVWSYEPTSASRAEKFAITHTEAEWRGMLTPEQYSVLREVDGVSFYKPTQHEHRKGLFACAGCDLDLFSSDTKFDSGTGLAELLAAIERAVGTEAIARSVCRGPPCIAAAAAAIWAMSSTMARRHRPSLLHQRRCDDLQTRSRLNNQSHGEPWPVQCSSTVPRAALAVLHASLAVPHISCLGPGGYRYPAAEA